MRIFGAFVEAMKKLAVAGIVSASFLALASFLSCVMDAADLGIVLCYLIPYITVPALVICAFGFLFKRKSCDVFFALPLKRNTLYLVNIIAVILWTLLSYLLPFLIVGLNTSFNYVISEYCGLYLGHLATCLYILGGTTVAIFLTGRIFTAIINSIIIAVVPRLVYLILCNAIFNKLEYLVKNAPGMPDLSGDSYLTMGFIEGETISYMVVGLIFLALGFVIFNKRKSETAEQSAPNKLLKITYSSLLAFSVSLIAIGHYIDRYGFFSVNDSTAWLLYGISILIPFAYDLITTRRFDFKNAFVSLMVLIVLNVLAYLSFFAGCSYFKNQKIDVAGYQIMNHSQQDEVKQRGHEYIYIWANYFDDSFAYNQILVNDYFLTDPECVELISTRFKEMQKNNGKSEEWENSYTVVLKDKSGKKYYRQINLDSLDIKKMWYYATNSDKEFIEKTATIPEPKEVKKVNCFSDASFDKKLYEIFYEEMMALTPEQRISLTYTVDNNCNIYMLESEKEICRSITVEGVKNGKKYRSIYVINDALCPKAFAMTKERMYKENKVKINEFLKKSESFEELIVQLEVMPQPNKYKNDNLKPYRIIAEKTASYKITKKNENIAWSVTDDEFVSEYSYNEHKMENVQAFFDCITKNLKDYESGKSYNAKVIIRYKESIYDAFRSVNYEFDMDYDEFREIYSILSRQMEG